MLIMWIRFLDQYWLRSDPNTELGKTKLYRKLDETLAAAFSLGTGSDFSRKSRIGSKNRPKEKISADPAPNKKLPFNL